MERAQPASRDGSSHGSARIFRYVYPDPFYVRLVVAAKAGFDELERLSGSPADHTVRCAGLRTAA